MQNVRVEVRSHKPQGKLFLRLVSKLSQLRSLVAGTLTGFLVIFRDVSTCPGNSHTVTCNP